MRRVFLGVLVCIAVMEAQGAREETGGGEMRGIISGSGVYEPFTMTESWDGWHLLYGPAEILSAPLLLFLGPAVGVNAPADVAAGEVGSDVWPPWRYVSGVGAGTAMGLAMTPVALVKGVYDTLTLGLFADGVFE